MNHSVYGDNKDNDWWRKVANRMAILFAVFIVTFGLVGVKISRENKSLDILKSSNTQLTKTVNSLTEDFVVTAGKLEETEKELEELKQKIFKLKIENAALKTDENASDK